MRLSEGQGTAGKPGLQKGPARRSLESQRLPASFFTHVREWTFVARGIKPRFLFSSRISLCVAFGRQGRHLGVWQVAGAWEDPPLSFRVSCLRSPGHLLSSWGISTSCLSID